MHNYLISLATLRQPLFFATILFVILDKRPVVSFFMTVRVGAGVS